MATFNLIAAPENLPAYGTRESPILDFKGKLDRTPDGKPKYFELAKDVAAMASVYGGTLLLRAHGGSQLARYEPLNDSEANEVCEAYQAAARDRCIPVPLLTTEKIPRESGYVVAVNIFPILDRSIAVKVKDAVEDRFGSDAYVFPVRLSTHAIPYSPESLPMLLNPAVRRIAILLESIPIDRRGAVTVYWAGYRRNTSDVAPVTPSIFELSSLDLEANVMMLRDKDTTFVVPLDDVESVWREVQTWSIRVRGHFENNAPRRYITRIRE